MERKAKDYTVGWICSREYELTAASMLDEKHATLEETSSQESNLYTLGSVQGHNIVVASLPLGYFGAPPLAAMVQDMLRSFPVIRFFLLVGVGSGVPSDYTDIRLGDVVVSYPSGASGGVVQFDIETAISKGLSSSKAGHLDRQPMTLRTAISCLRAEHMQRGSRCGRYIGETYKKHSKMTDDYSFPGRSRDLLFQEQYRHLRGKVDCSSCDKSCLIIRDDRDDETPTIHYGTIASAQFEIRDATIRDKFSKGLDAICFETEVAEVMKALPCVVIKGIADYADSHRARDWQSYAALAAAAYTKELLSVLPADACEQMDAAADLLDPSFLDNHIVSHNLDYSDKRRQTSTAIETLDERVVTTAIMEVAHVLATEDRLRVLCTAAVQRFGPSGLQSILSVVLAEFSNALKKKAQTPVERGMRWLFSRYRPFIATFVAENICKQDYVSGSLGLSRNPPSTPADRPLKSISERYPETKTSSTAPNPSRASALQNLASAGVTTQETDEDVDLNLLSPPESSLVDLSQLDQILCEGQWFEDLLENMESLLLPSVTKMIERTLERHTINTAETFAINCSIEWELLSYARSEDLSIEEIDNIFILVGDFDYACAIPLGWYMSETWKTGKEVLEVVKAVIANAFNNVFDTLQTNAGVEDTPVNGTSIQLFPAASSDQREHAVVKIAGSVGYIQHTLEQFALLASTLRLPHEGQLTISYVDFRPQKIQIGSSGSRDFKLCLWDQERLPKPEGKKGQCWTQLFIASTLAYGFSLPGKKRPDGMLGLEVPFEIMSAFSGARYPVLLGERLAFASQTHILVPEMTSGGSIQWHYDTIDNALQTLKTAIGVTGSRLDDFDAASLREFRAFLGYNKFSEILIGTADFEGVNITACDVPSTKAKLLLMNQGSLSLGVSLKGFATTSVSGNWKFNRGEIGQIKSSELSLDESLKAAAESPALMYDDGKCLAFLVPELSIALQMTATYLQENSSLAASKIPRAKRSPDGGKAAYEAVEEAKNLKVPLRTENPRQYVDVLRSFLDLFDQRRLQQSANREFYGFSFKKDGLRGWDYTDIQKKNFQFFERELSTSLFKSRPNWWELFDKSNTLIFFSRATMQPIRGCNNHDSPSCISWNTIPEGQHLLLANVRDLLRFKSKSCQSSKHSRHFMLTEKLAWARPTKSRLFEQTCTEGGRCNPLQTVCEPSSLKRNVPRKYLTDPGDLEPNGSVLFAGDLSEFKDRPCSIAFTDQNTGHLNQGTHNCLDMCSTICHDCVGRAESQIA